jgi:hypothetical protein
MKLFDIILLSLSAGFLIIGIHQIMTVGFAASYWLMMMSSGLLFVYALRKRSRHNGQSE